MRRWRREAAPATGCSRRPSQPRRPSPDGGAAADHHVAARLIGIGTETDPTFGVVSGYTQQTYSQVLAFVPGAQIMIRQRSRLGVSAYAQRALANVVPATVTGADDRRPAAATLAAGFGSGSITGGTSIGPITLTAGLYYIGCGFHYLSNGMRTVLNVATAATPGPQATAVPRKRPPPTIRLLMQRLALLVALVAAFLGTFARRAASAAAGARSVTFRSSIRTARRFICAISRAVPRRSRSSQRAARIRARSSTRCSLGSRRARRARASSRFRSIPTYDTPFVMADFAREMKATHARVALSSPGKSGRRAARAARRSVSRSSSGTDGIPDAHSDFVYVLDHRGQLVKTLPLSTHSFADLRSALTKPSLEESSGAHRKAPEMKTRKLGAAGPEVSAIALGCMAMSGAGGPADRAESIATIHAALDVGINLLDTGDFYGNGHNELLIAEALRGRKREDVLLSVKFGAMRSPGGLGRRFRRGRRRRETSLRIRSFG